MPEQQKNKGTNAVAIPLVEWQVELIKKRTKTVLATWPSSRCELFAMGQ